MTRDSSGPPLAIENENLARSASVQFDRAGEPGWASADHDDVGHRCAAASSALTSAPQ
jgi:hypothetical protein